MALLEAVFANKQGQTPQDVDRRRRMAQALIESGSGGRPPSSGLELAGRLAMTLTGQYQAGKADRLDQEGQARGNQALIDALYGPSGSSGQSSSSIPMSGAGAELGNSAPAKVDMTGNQVYGDFINTVKEGGVKNPYALAAIAATGKAESGFSPGNVNRTWDDPSASGQPGRAGGIMSWRGPRYAALAATGDLSPAGQARFFLQEDPKLIAALNNAKSVDEAQSLMNRAWAFRGYDQPGGEAARRLSLANGFLPSFQGQGQPTQVASLDPAAGMQSSPIPAPGAQAQIQGPTPPAPPLPAPTTVANPPPVAAQPPQQVAQALMAPPSAPAGVPRERIAGLLKDPYTAEAGQMLLMQEMKRRQDMQAAQYEQQLRMSDPKYQQDLAKGQIELQNLREPKMSPSEAANLKLNQDKFAADTANNADRLALDKDKLASDKENNSARLKLDRDKFDAEVQKGQWQKLTDGRLYNQTTGEFRDAPPPVPGSVPPKMDDISGMRKEIQQLPSYKNLAQAAPIYKAMVETAGRDTKASDLNLVYGLGKIMDPNSVVREGEMVMVKNTSSLPDWLQGAIASLNGGAALTPETRQAIMTEAYGRVKGYNDEFQQNMGQYQGIVQRNGINPADVIPAPETFEPWKAPAPTPATSPAPSSGENPLPATPPARPQSQADFDALKPGSIYIDPDDGKQYRK